MDKVVNGVFVGSRPMVKSFPEKRERKGIESVVSLTKKHPENDFDIPHRHHPLEDGKNEQADFNAAVDTVRTHLQDGNTVFVHCNIGRSRSPAVVATAVAAERDLLFSEGVSLIRDAGRQTQINVHLREHAAEYLEQDSHAL